ncbi:MAG: RdgB/HAM1 family non-canonical purine NTP pyrophosphatase [Oscillospiraceae bacterium]|nr:RdgB/HAM1 family non-canonical purine NTP pyrophosphatase [Oscillospiraceae bacterium]
MRYILATANPGKIKEMRDILSGLGIEVVTRDGLGIQIAVEETGTTFYENAKLKAEAICAASKMPSIADDSGLVVEALDGRPGVYSSSYGGEALTAEQRCMFLLDEMKKTEQRRAKFVCNIVCVFPDGNILSAAGECNGTISTEIKGVRGFGYDPVFVPDGYIKTMAELSSEEKNAISHRGKALLEFISKLKEKCV